MRCPSCGTLTDHGHCHGCYRIASEWRDRFIKWAVHASTCATRIVTLDRVVITTTAPRPASCTCGLAALLTIAQAEQQTEKRRA